MSSQATRDGWAEGIDARARAYWTAERTRGLLGDKQLLLPPAESGPLLRALDLLNGDASMPTVAVRKYLQINHMVALLEPLMLDLVRAHPVVRLLDVACGKSYLALLLAWCFQHRYHHPVQVLGIDRNRELIDKCRDRVPLVQLEPVLRFEATHIEDLDLERAWAAAFGPQSAPVQVHGLVALHACDTATDDALALGARLGAEVIAVAPCCHAELARHWSALDQARAPGAFAPIWASPHLRREAAATMTDALRTLLMRAAGYVVTPMEFVPSSHTPKNTLLRAVCHHSSSADALQSYLTLRAALGDAPIRLEGLLPALQDAVENRPRS